MADENELTNHKFKAAKMPSYYLAETGNEYAKKILDTAGFDKQVLIDSFPEFEEMNLPNIIGQDVSYNSINYQARKSGNKVILEFACGFTPRGLEMINEGYNYCGGDIQTVVPVVKPLIKSLADNSADNIDYCVVDIRDADTLLKASESFPEGPVTIVLEGLMPYLNSEDCKTLISEIISILKNRGGCFISPDCNTNEFSQKIFQYILGQDAAEKADKTREAMKKYIAGDSRNNTENSLEDALKMMSEAGLSVEVLPLYLEDMDYESFKLVDEDKREELKKLFKEGVLVKATFDPDKSKPNDELNFEFAVLPEYDNGILKIKVNGRLDSVTAPKLQKVYESIDNADLAEEIIFDFSELQYVSSAGLRVLLSIKKKNDERTVRVVNAIDSIKEVFDMTGFNYLLDID